MNPRFSKSSLVYGLVVIVVLAAFVYAASMSGSIPNEGGEWSSYVDKDFDYRIDHPKELRAYPIAEDVSEGGGDLVEDGGVSFAVPDLPGTMGVKVYMDAPLDSLEEWLASENKEKERIRKEKTIMIDGHEALVTYYVSVTPSQEEIFAQEKRTVILKDGDLFEIWTKFYEDEGDHARVWDSFRFQK